jgi:hypothetical protein
VRIDVLIQTQLEGVLNGDQALLRTDGAFANMTVLVRVLAWQGSWVLVLVAGGCLRCRSSVTG